MKKFLTIMLAMLCICTMGIAADPDTKTTTVEYAVDSAYTWAIHDGIDFGSNLGVGHNDATSSQTAQIDSADNGVTVSQNIIDDGKKLQITVIGANMSSDQYRVVNGSTYLNYAISKNRHDSVAVSACGTGLFHPCVCGISRHTSGAALPDTYILAYLRRHRHYFVCDRRYTGCCG